MNSKPRILHVSLADQIGGAEKSLILLAENLQYTCDIKLACPVHGKLGSHMNGLGLSCYDVPKCDLQISSLIRSIVSWISRSLYLIKIMLRTDIDIIHANNIYAMIVSVAPSYFLRKKLIWHCRDLVRHRHIVRICSLFCSKIIAVSKAVSDKLIGDGVDAQKIEVVYNGVKERVVRASGTQGCQKTDSTFVFANIGQFVPWKNQAIFLKAASLITPELPNARFLIVGDDLFKRNSDYKRELIDLAKRLSITANVDFVGWVEDMETIWHRVDCLVHTTDREPFGRVLIEALAHTIPVIGVKACGPDEIIQDGQTGILVKANNVEALGNAMLKIASSPQFAIKLAMNGYKHVTTNFTAKATAACVYRIYQEVLGREDG